MFLLTVFYRFIVDNIISRKNFKLPAIVRLFALRLFITAIFKSQFFLAMVIIESSVITAKLYCLIEVECITFTACSSIICLLNRGGSHVAAGCGVFSFTLWKIWTALFLHRITSEHISIFSTLYIDFPYNSSVFRPYINIGWIPCH